MHETPWEGYMKPGKICGNVYFVGTYPASTHLIDTGEGLIIIDPGYPESLYLVIHNIWSLGFDPKDIKYIVLSHGHYDHAGAVKALVELTGAKTFISKVDSVMVNGDPSGIRRKEFTLKPMSMEEAIMQMNLLGHEFFVYKDDNTNEVCVVYKRKDGDYGLIETHE